MAPLIRKMKLPHLPMAYLLINGDRVSTTQKVTRTQALDPKQSTYIINTCLAAEDLGFRLIYLEAGSGASQHIPHSLIKKIKQQVSIPLIVGGGIDSVDKVEHMITTGANLIVVGNALEKNVYLLTELMRCFPQQK
jgi:putative glycerol-1-phosphate prenyltransferase